MACVCFTYVRRDSCVSHTRIDSKPRGSHEQVGYVESTITWDVTRLCSPTWDVTFVCHTQIDARPRGSHEQIGCVANTITWDWLLYVHLRDTWLVYIIHANKYDTNTYKSVRTAWASWLFWKYNFENKITWDMRGLYVPMWDMTCVYHTH